MKVNQLLRKAMALAYVYRENSPCYDVILPDKAD
jgi:hypothetical protein